MNRLRIILSATFILLFMLSCYHEEELKPLEEFEIFLNTPYKDSVVMFNTSYPFSYDMTIPPSINITYRDEQDKDELIFLNGKPIFMPPGEEPLYEGSYGENISIAFKTPNNKTDFYLPQIQQLLLPEISGVGNENIISIGTKLKWTTDPMSKHKIIIRVSDGDQGYNTIYTEDNGEFILTSNMFHGIKPEVFITISIERYNFQIFQIQEEEYQIYAIITRSFSGIYKK